MHLNVVGKKPIKDRVWGSWEKLSKKTAYQNRAPPKKKI